MCWALVRVTSFEFLLKVIILKECFELSRYSSDYLQREEMDMVTAVDSVQSLISQVSTFRSELKYSKFMEEAKSKAIEWGINYDFNSSNKRRRALPSRLSNSQTLLSASLSHIAASNDDLELNISQ